MSKRLWEKGIALDDLMHQFTVGDDPKTDLHFLHWDILASAAHAKMLEAIGVLEKSECADLLAGLKRLLSLHQKEEFIIPAALEDCHTAIEAFLSEEVGEAGKKIHTGRSRNDQILVAARLYLRASLLGLSEKIITTVEALLEQAEEHAATPMPGYTHHQAAMPTTVGTWLHATADALLDVLKEGNDLLNRFSGNPLGAASGFGSPLPLDRELTTKLLGFSFVQQNPMDVANSRGRYELKLCRWCSDIASILEKFACDMVLFSSSEFAFMSLPAAFTTGSSIMPQKRNLDVMELLRARASRLRASEIELAGSISKLPSSYHRDHQYTKEPLVRSVSNTAEMLEMTARCLPELIVNKQRLEDSMQAELFATAEVYARVQNKESFRDAYQAVAKEINDGTFVAKEELSDIAPLETAARAYISKSKKELDSLSAKVTKEIAKLNELETTVFS